MAADPFFEQTDLYAGRTDVYHTFRIPSIVTTTRGTVLAFCEGRRDDRSDTGDIDMLLKRSEDGGKTWSGIQVIWDDDRNTCGNPCPVVDRDTGIIWLLMTHNLGRDTERQIHAREGVGTRTVWVSKSEDDGTSWSEPVEISDSTKRPDWTWYATGPGAGIQLESGRLVIPCDHKVFSGGYYSHVIYSDDHGETWRIGGIVPFDQVNECEVLQLESGRLLINMRNYDRSSRARAVATSDDEGMSWSAVSHDETLVEPMCQASIRRFTEREGSDLDCVLFSNPASETARESLTVRLSYDECQTWPFARQLNAGPSGYSCLAILPDGSIACMYERGDDDYCERITLARFNLEWLKDG